VGAAVVEVIREAVDLERKDLEVERARQAHRRRAQAAVEYLRQALMEGMEVRELHTTDSSWAAEVVEVEIQRDRWVYLEAAMAAPVQLAEAMQRRIPEAAAEAQAEERLQ
jgi:hypothetical protein